MLSKEKTGHPRHELEFVSSPPESAKGAHSSLSAFGGEGRGEVARLLPFSFFTCSFSWSPLNSQPLQAAIFTTPVTINEGDAAYEGQDIVVDGTTVTINGPHAFNSLLLTNGAVLTHSPCTASETHTLDGPLPAPDGPRDS